MGRLDNLKRKCKFLPKKVAIVRMRLKVRVWIREKVKLMAVLQNRRV